MQVRWRLGLTSDQWQALPDDEKDDWLGFLEWRARRIERFTKKLIDKKAYTGEAAATLFAERL